MFTFYTVVGMLAILFLCDFVVAKLTEGILKTKKYFQTSSCDKTEFTKCSPAIYVCYHSPALQSVAPDYLI